MMQIRTDDLTHLAVIELLEYHVRCAQAVSPPESCHALDVEGLRRPEITFWTIWQGEELAGCIALKMLDAEHGEIKSMRTADAFLRQGVASKLLQHLLAEATRRGVRRLSLETGAEDYFTPAREFYTKFGFTEREPFGNYRVDPNSVFLTKEL
jgi:putative acetyltransferase